MSTPPKEEILLISPCKSFDSIAYLSIEELYEKVKKYKREVEILGLENYWMREFFSHDFSNVLQNIDKALSQNPPITNLKIAKLFQSSAEFEDDLKYSKVAKAFRQLSRRYSISSSNSIRVSQIIQNVPINVAFKNELCMNTIANLKREILSEQKKHLELVKDIQAQMHEIKIDKVEFANAKREYLKNVTKPKIKVKKRKFLKEFKKSGNILLELIRMKIDTMKIDVTKQKKKLKKHAELSGCLRPVDFELIEIEKKKSLKMSKEKRSHYFGLKHEEREVISQKSEEHEKFLQATDELKNLENQISMCDKVISRMRKELTKSEKEKNQEVEKLINDLREKICKYKAPSIVDYIEKEKELQVKKKELKKAHRQKELAKIKFKVSVNKLTKN